METKKRRRWTEEEDEILKKEVEKCPYAKETAFREASKKLDRTVSACHIRWYAELSNPESKHYVGCVFTLLAEKAVTVNRTTNTLHSNPIKPKKGFWSRIKEMLGIDK